jgi:hypothetical protein
VAAFNLAESDPTHAAEQFEKLTAERSNDVVVQRIAGRLRAGGTASRSDSGSALLRSLEPE